MNKIKFFSRAILLFAFPMSVIHAENNDDTVTINLEISDGQNGSQLPESEEESPGTFTVANKNDTDGDGIIDNEDDNVQNEIDLMQLKLHPPTNADPDVECILSLPVNAKIFKEKTKMGGEETVRRWKVRDLPKTYWVELQEASASLQHEVISWSALGKIDTCKATGIWVVHRTNSFRNKNTDVIWATCGNPAKDTFIKAQAIFGKNFAVPNGKIGYGAGFEFLCLPQGLVAISKVKFDVTRQKHSRSWEKSDGVWNVLKIENVSTNVDFPYINDSTKIEHANDDELPIDPNLPPNVDNDNVPNAGDFIYSIDGPGIDNLAIADVIVRKINFNEFVRVAVNGVQPAGPGKQGSATSEKVKWHVFMGLKRNPNYIDLLEDSNLINSVDLGHKEINNENENAP